MFLAALKFLSVTPTWFFILIVFWHLRWFFKQEWKRYSLAIAALIAVGFITMVPPWLVGIIVDAIADSSITRAQLLQYVGWILLAAFCSYGFRIVWRMALFGASYQLANQLRLQIFEHLSGQSPTFYQQSKTGDLMARATNDIQAVEMTAGEAVLAFFDGFFTATLVLIIMMAMISWQLTLLALIPWPIAGYFMWRFGEELGVSFTKAQEKFSTLNDMVQESISALRLTRAFGREQHEIEQFMQVATAANKANLDVARTESKYDPAISLAVGCSFLLSVSGGAYFIHHDQMSLGQLTSFTLYLGYMIWPMFAVGWLFNILKRGQAAYLRVQALLTSETHIKDNGQFELQAEPSIDFAISKFAYPDSHVATLESIHINVEAGNMLGIAGHTGSGKSTLIRLLTRLEEHAQSSVKIDGIVVADFTLHNLRRHIATVTQTPFLFSTSIAENISLANPEASLEEIKRVAHLAHIHDDIARFDKGYDTRVGELGITLSGGQKQRISIARALLQNAPILILDDALSAVDVHTETVILKHLRESRKNRTTIVISHRLSALKHANEIIVLEKGKIGERGTHKQLIALGGYYKSTYDYQQLEQAIEGNS